MPKKRSTAAGGGKDRISELPEELLHSIIRHIPCPKETAQTSTLSSRWRHFWCSYPVAEFNSTNIEGLRRFVDATMKKFSPDKLLRMEALKVSLDLYDITICSPSVKQLLDLASKKKADYVAIEVNTEKFMRSFVFLWLPLESLSNSSARTLHLEKIKFEPKKNGEDNNLHLSLDSLLHLRLEFVEFLDHRLFTSLMASSPLLETLEICFVNGIRKLNLPNLKTLKISCMEEDLSRMFRKEFIAPQLNTLEITGCKYLRLCDISRVVSKLQNLKSLTLSGSGHEKKLKLSCPKLEEFNLSTPYGLEEIELDVKPCFRKFILNWRRCLPGVLKKCEIHGAAADCQWEVDFYICDIALDFFMDDVSHHWFLELKRFMIRFPRFHTISISYGEICKDGEADHGEHPVSKEHLKIMVLQSSSSTDNAGFLNGLFRICHPRFLTVGYERFHSKSLLEFFLDLTSHYSDKPLTKETWIKSKHQQHRWLHQLKDVKIKSRKGHQTIDTKQEINAISERIASLPAFEVCFELTW
ncbi:F-box protein At5g03100 [Linum grandiflorum]